MAKDCKHLLPCGLCEFTDNICVLIKHKINIMKADESVNDEKNEIYNESNATADDENVDLFKSEFSGYADSANDFVEWLRKDNWKTEEIIDVLTSLLDQYGSIIKELYDTDRIKEYLIKEECKCSEACDQTCQEEVCASANKCDCNEDTYWKRPHEEEHEEDELYYEEDDFCEYKCDCDECEDKEECDCIYKTETLTHEESREDIKDILEDMSKDNPLIAFMLDLI